jgi:parvulin-like peptidyl-prolyl isomerase
MKFLRFIPILALTLCVVLPLRAELVDGIVAVVNGTVITRQQVDDFAAAAIDALQRQYAGQPDVFQQKYDAVINDGLEQLIERQLILDDFEAQGYRVPDSLWDEWVQARIRDRFAGDRVTLMKTLQAQGETFEQFRREVRDQNIETFMRSKKISQEIIVSPYQIEQYYEAHQKDFKVEDEVKLRMIVLNKTSDDDTNTLALAREILAKIKQGASFADMARVYSQDSLRSQGGDRGWVERSVLRKELADAAFALAPGQVSNVIDLPDACYLMFVEDKHPAHTRSLNEVRDDIERTLRAQEQARLQKQWIDRMKAKAFIRYF